MRFFTDYETKYRYVRITATGNEDLMDFRLYGHIATLRPHVVEWLNEHAPKHTVEKYGSAIIIDFFDDDAAFHFMMVFR